MTDVNDTTGASSGPQIRKILASGFCEGVIWDPRDLRPKKINQYIQENEKYDWLLHMMEFKQYYQQFDKSDKKKLKDYVQFPTAPLDRTF